MESPPGGGAEGAREEHTHTKVFSAMAKMLILFTIESEVFAASSQR